MPPTWSQVAPLFDELRELAPAARDERLARLRASSQELAEELALLLAADAAPGGLLDSGLAGAIAEDLSGELAGAYRLLAKIGHGGMGDVYAAERADGLFAATVAVKVVTAPHSPEVMRRFVRERAILAGLAHPNIARLLDAGSIGGRPYLVMELVDGETVVAHCDQRRAGVDARLRTFLQVCAAVAFAHRHLVVHRDLKPSNVMVSAAGEVKLLDFGIAALFDPADGAAVTTQARRAFTPAYAAPEQLLGRAATTLTDVYGLGALLHELLVGSPPAAGWGEGHRGGAPHLTATFGALDDGQAAAVAAARDAEPRGLVHRLRGDLDAIVAVALRAEPEARYPSVEALASDVARHLAGEPVVARGQDRLYRTRLFVGRHRVSVAAIVLAFVALAAGFGVAVSQARAARSEAVRAGALRRFLTMQLKRSLLEEGPRPGGPTVGWLFDHGLADVDARFHGEPEAAAEIFAVAGEAYRMMSANERAIAAFRASLARQQALYGGDDPHLRSARFDLAHALFQRQGSPGNVEARAILEQLERDTRGEMGEQRDDILDVLGEVQRVAGDLDAAEATHRQYLANVDRLYGERSAARLQPLKRLALVLYLTGRFRESLRMLDEAAAIELADRQETEAQAATVWLRRAQTLHRIGALDAAERDYRQAAQELAASPQAWPSAHIACGLGFLLAERGDLAAARPLLAEPALATATPEDGYGGPGAPCPALAAWVRGDDAAMEAHLGLTGVGAAPLSAVDRADRGMLLAERLLARGRHAEAWTLSAVAVSARDANPDLEPWRRSEAHLLRDLALVGLGHGEARRAVGVDAMELAVRQPRHRFLALAAAAEPTAPAPSSP